MLLADIDAQIAQTNAEIFALNAKLLQLRRRRNALMPLLKLPVELTTQIMEYIVEEDIEGAPTLFSCIPFTQFCADWRNVALNHPALWTRVSTSHGRWFEICLQRSRNRLLHVDTASCNHPQSAADPDDMFRRLAVNMHRVYELSIRPHSNLRRLDWLQYAHAPQLQILRYVCDDPRYHRGVPVNAALRYFPSPGNTMPKLRLLEVDCSLTHGLDIFLPSCLPTITDLNLRNLEYKTVLDILQRSKAVRNLSISNISTVFMSAQAPTARILLPALQNARSQDTSPRFLSFLAFPSLRRMNLNIPSNLNSHVFPPALVDYTSLARELERFSHPPRQDPRISHFSLSIRESPPTSTLIRLLGRNGAGEDVLTLSARSTVQVGMPLMPLPGFQVSTDPIGTLNKFLDVAKSIKIPIRSVMVEENIRRNAQAHLLLLRDSIDITTIHIRGIESFFAFLSFYNVNHNMHGIILFLLDQKAR
ncbi:hypothetical protein AX16_004653 [Volvariella volvacea WC 439]|nr:hypothetical protein AX16_004653 [Volvariella volvacea WC 439]